VSGVIRWEGPPEDQRSRKLQGRLDHDEIVEELRSNPGQWGLISVNSAGLASAINQGRMSAYRPAGTFFAVARLVDGEHRCYARYVGDPS
jgi:hypothetical protein